MAGAMEWLAEQHAEDQRRFTQLLLASFVAHALLGGLVVFAPTSDAPLLKDVMTVDLVAGVPSAGPAPSKPRPAPPAAKPRSPKPVPQAIPKPAPKPLPKEVVLPKEAPRAVPKKKRKPVVAPAPSKPVQYEDALSQLRDELGEDTPAPVVSDAAAEVSPGAAQETAAAEAAAASARERSAWGIAVQRHVRQRYITPPEFLNRALATGLQVVLTSGGELVGPPRVTRSSGDPFFDDNAVRAMMMSAPLPAPPEPGPQQFLFRAED